MRYYSGIYIKFDGATHLGNPEFAPAFSCYTDQQLLYLSLKVNGKTKKYTEFVITIKYIVSININKILFSRIIAKFFHIHSSLIKIEALNHYIHTSFNKYK